MKKEFLADKIKISGPMSDNSYKISFWTGEYEQENVAELFKIPPMTALQVTVEEHDDRRQR